MVCLTWSVRVPGINCQLPPPEGSCICALLPTFSRKSFWPPPATEALCTATGRASILCASTYPRCMLSSPRHLKYSDWLPGLETAELPGKLHIPMRLWPSAAGFHCWDPPGVLICLLQTKPLCASEQGTEPSEGGCTDKRGAPPPGAPTFFLKKNACLHHWEVKVNI